MLKEKVKEKRFGSVRLQMFATEQTYTGERSNLGYKLFSGKTLIFQGEDFRPSAMDAIDSDAAAFTLLGFLTLKPGDTDREHFDDYTPAQLEWCQSAEAERISRAVYEFEERESRKRRRAA
jgi:hypothetical protein